MKTRYLRLVKKQRGFTLIELLAVILILGIIALIAIPTVSSVVEQSRKGAAESSASQFVVSVNELVMTSDLMGEKIIDGIYTTNDLVEKGLNIKGTLPDDGIIQIKNSEVVGCNFTYGNYNVLYDGTNFESKKVEEATKFVLTEDNDSNNTVSVKDKVCLDSECFYVINVVGDSVRMLTEWNLNVGYELMQNNQYNLGSVPANIYSSVYEGTILSGAETVNYVKLNTSDFEIKQDSNMRGFYRNPDNGYQLQARGIVSPFKLIASAKENYVCDYWTDSNHKLLSKYGESFPADVYSRDNALYNYIESYANNIKISSGISNISGDLINKSDLPALSCNPSSFSCSNTPSWLTYAAYWTGVASGVCNIYVFDGSSSLSNNSPSYLTRYGLRPVITVSKDLIS